MDKSELSWYREFLKDSLRLQLNFQLTDQNQGIAPPPLQKPQGTDQALIPLPDKAEWPQETRTDLLAAIEKRHSHRRFKNQALTLSELALLLWATQGVKTVLAPGTALRTVPSAGCRHPFETYLAINQVESLQPGIYRYLPVDHALVLERRVDTAELRPALAEGTLGQAFAATAPLCFIWAAIPHRSEWRYHTAAHRVMLMDVGHICQNLYLACEAIGCGTCAIAAYQQELMDQLIGVDGEDEFTTYLAPVGKV